MIRRRQHEPVFRALIYSVIFIWLSMAVGGYCLKIIRDPSDLSLNHSSCHLVDKTKASIEHGISGFTVCLDVHSAHSPILADSIPDLVHFLLLPISTVAAVLIALFVQIRPRKGDPPPGFSGNLLYYVFCSQLK